MTLTLIHLLITGAGCYSSDLAPSVYGAASAVAGILTLLVLVPNTHKKIPSITT
jgi:hypothetical protein